VRAESRGREEQEGLRRAITRSRRLASRCNPTNVASAAPRSRSRYNWIGNIASESKPVGREDGAVFTDSELRFLVSLQQGRLVTIGPDDAPQIHPVTFVVDSDLGSVDISSTRLRDSQKYRNVRRDPRVSLVVDDPTLPLRGFDELSGRGLEIHGMAELAEKSGADVIRIRPVRLDRWNLGDAGHHSRFVT
jgi:pyridoxamine 5'-phosphate oxidase family protein